MQINFQNILHQPFYNIKQPQISAVRIKPQLSCDTVNFTGHWDLLKLSDKTIFQRIKAATSDRCNYIGEGGEAKVYKITNKETNESYAAKILNDEIQSLDDDNRLLILREVTILPKMKYESIINFIGYRRRII